MPDKVKIYTIQHEEVVSDLFNNKKITGDHNYSLGKIWDSPGQTTWADAYDWMRGQMSAAVPNFSGSYPIWGWLKPEPVSNKRRKYLSQSYGDRIVRIDAIVPKARCLFSDFSLWHCILNNWYVARTQTEDSLLEQAIENKTLDIKTTWPRIFDVFRPKTQEELKFLGKDTYVQVCVDSIFDNEIIKIRYIDK